MASAPAPVARATRAQRKRISPCRAAILLAVLLAVLFSLGAAAQAACSLPTGNAGDMIYNNDYHVYQYCDGTLWHGAGPNGAGGSGCGGTTSNLAGWWKLTDGSGTNAADSSGNGNTGTLQNSPIWTTGGPNGGGLTLNGTSQYVKIAAPGLDGSGAATISAWVYATSDSNYSIPYILDTGYKGVECGIDSANSGEYICSDNNMTNYAVSAPGSLVLNTWQFFTAVRDSAGNFTFYINGVQSGTASQPTTAPTTGTFDTAIGSAYGGNTYFFQGTLDDVRIYNVALSAAQVAALASPSGVEGDVMYNGAYHVMQYCNGANWVAMGPTGGGAGGTNNITLLQHTGTTYTTTDTFPSTTTAGSLIVVCAQWWQISAPLASISVSDTAGNAFTNAILTNNGSTDGTSACYYAINKAATASDTVTISTTQDSDDNAILLAEFSGISSTSPLDVTAAATGNSSSANSSSATTTTANDLIFGMCMPYTSATAGAGFTALDVEAGNPDEYKTVTAAGSYNTTCTLTSQQWIMQMIAFKGAACSNPFGNEADMIYNHDHGVMQYCNGTSWIGIGQ